jgi:hypothetical protein
MQPQAFNIPMSAMSVYWDINCVDIIAETCKAVSVPNATKISRRSEDVNYSTGLTDRIEVAALAHIQIL